MSASKIKTIKGITDQNQITEAREKREKYTPYIKKRIPGLKEKLSEHNLTDENAIIKIGREYLERLPKSIEKDEIGELALEWRKYKGLTKRKEITEANRKRRRYIYYIKNKNYFKQYQIENKEHLKQQGIEKKISELEKILNNYGFTDEESIKAKGFEYLERISKGIEKEYIGELTLEWMKRKEIIDQKQITEERKKGWYYNRYKKGSSEETLEEKTNESLADDYDKNESYGDLIKTINDDDKKKPYESLIELIDVGVKSKRGKKAKKEFIIETLVAKWYECIKSDKDVLTKVKGALMNHFTTSITGPADPLGDALSEKARGIYAKICHGDLIFKYINKRVISFLKAHYNREQIKGAIKSGKILIKLKKK